jgi:Ca2+-binding RTX toxin-like protein
MTTTRTLASDGQSQTLSAADAAGWQIQLGNGLTQTDLQWVWTTAADGATGRYTLQLTQGRGELVGPQETLALGARPDRPRGLTAVKLADGTDITAAVLAAARTQVQYRGPVLPGTLGDDTLVAGADGGQRHKLDGGTGADTYVVHPGWGQVTVADADGGSTLVFSDLQRSDLSWQADAQGNLVFSHDSRRALNGLQQGQVDTLLLTGAAASRDAALASLSAVSFANGDSLTADQVYAQMGAVPVTPNPVPGVTVKADAMGQTLVGGAGDDELYDMGWGSITTRWTAGQGNDTVHMGRTTNTLLLDSPDLIVTGAVTPFIQFREAFLKGQFVFESPRTGTHLTLSFDPAANSVYSGGVMVAFADGSPGWTLGDLIRFSASNALGPINAPGSDDNDTLRGDALAGGPGDDLLNLTVDNSSTAAAATALYSLGDGHDTVTGGSNGRLKLGAGVTPGQVVVKAASAAPNGQPHFLLSFVDHLGDVDLQGVTQVVFDNGVTWRQADLEQHVSNATLPATDGEQNFAWAGPGLNLSLTGGSGADSLRGGAGADTLNGGAGDDTLAGGLGNDVLTGGAGHNQYVFYAGDGQDVVNPNVGDQLVMYGYSSSDLKIGPLAANGSLMLSLSNTAGQALKLQVNGAQTANLGLLWGDGSRTAWADVLAEATKPASLTLTGTSGADKLQGQSGDDTLSGLAGNDSLNGGAGNDSLTGGLGADTLQGGVGNDTLVGDKGNDTYLFGRGDGRDLIVDKDSTLFNADLLKFSGATSKQLWFTRSGNNLDVAIIGTPDKVSIQDWFVSSANRVEKFTAGDGKSLSAARVSALVSAMSSFTNQAMAGTDLGSNVPATVTKLIASSWA